MLWLGLSEEAGVEHSGWHFFREGRRTPQDMEGGGYVRFCEIIESELPEHSQMILIVECTLVVVGRVFLWRKSRICTLYERGVKYFKYLRASLRGPI